MAWKIEITQGGEVGAPVVDFTSQIPVFTVGDGSVPQIKMGMSYENGAASVSTILVDDDTGEMPKADGTKAIRAHNRVLYNENVGGTDYWLSVGWVGPKNVGRNPVHYLPDARQWSVQVEDANALLRGLGLTADVSRPEETGWARASWVASTYLNGSPRVTTVVTFSDTHLAPNTNTDTMPAADYEAGTPIAEILADCADTEGKFYGIVIHHTGGSHLCFQYVTPLDHTTYLSALKISDIAADHDLTSTTAPVVPPAWDQGPASIEDGQELATALINRYGLKDRFVYVEDTSKIGTFDYYLQTVHDDRSKTAAQATLKANALLDLFKGEHITHQVTIRLHRNQIHLITAGMSLQIKSAAALGGELIHAYQNRRVVECIFEPASGPANAPEWYTVYLKLDRPRRFRRVGRGQHGATTPKPAPEVVPQPEDTITVIAEWHWEAAHGTLDDTDTYDSFIPRDPAVHTWTSPGPAGSMAANHGDLGNSGEQTDAMPVTAGTTITVSIGKFRWKWAPSGRTISIVFYPLLDGTGTPVETWTFEDGSGRLQNVVYTDIAGTHTVPVGALSCRVEWSSGHGLSLIDDLVVGTIDPADEVVNDPHAVAYDPDCPHESPHFLPSDYVICLLERYADQIAELQLGLSEVDTTTGLATLEDLEEYQTVRSGGKEVISVVTAAGATETLDLVNGNYHDVTLTADCTLTLTGATAGVACSMAVLLRQGSGAPWDVTWPASVEWVGGSAPTLQTAANTWDWVALVTLNGGTTWFAQHTTGGALDADEVRDIGHWETIVAGSAPPVAVTNEAADDWLVGWVAG